MSVVSRCRIRWWMLAGSIATIVHTGAAVFMLTPDPQGGRDGIFFQYIGQHPGLPYVHVWDVKPPLIHAVANGLAALTPDPTALHVASVTVMTAVAVATALVIGQLAVEYTDSPLAGITAVLAWLAFPTVIWLPARGLRPKGFVLLFGFGALLALRRDHYRTAAAAGTIAAGFWQLALIFPTVVAAALLRARRWRTLGHAALIGLAIALVAVLPYHSPRAFRTMIVQVVVVPFLFPEAGGPLTRLSSLHGMVTTGLGVLVIAPAGYYTLYSRHQAWWELAAVTGWFAVQVLFIDLDGPPDVVLLYACAAVATAVFVGNYQHDRLRVVVLSVLLAAVVGAVLAGPAPGAFDVSQRVDVAYWSGQRLGCHVQYSWLERQFIARFGESAGRCGPYAVFG